MFKGNYKKRIDLLKKFFHRKCLFCEMIIEASVAGFEKKESKTVLNLCEFCLNKFEVIQELKQDEKANEGKIQEITNCFYGKCYFCNDELFHREVYSIGNFAEKFLGSYIIRIHVCNTCCARYNSLCEFEQERKRLELEQELQTQIQIPPK